MGLKGGEAILKILQDGKDSAEDSVQSQPSVLTKLLENPAEETDAGTTQVPVDQSIDAPSLSTPHLHTTSLFKEREKEYHRIISLEIPPKLDEIISLIDKDGQSIDVKFEMEQNVTSSEGIQVKGLITQTYSREDLDKVVGLLKDKYKPLEAFPLTTTGDTHPTRAILVTHKFE